MKRTYNWRWVSVICLAALVTSAAAAQDMRASLFAGVDARLAEAMELQADVLAPKSFGEFKRLYDRAEANLAKGQQIEKIRADLTEADKYLGQAMEATKLATVTFPAVLDARSDAGTAEASKYANDLWAKAEKRFADAATTLENGDVNGAKKGAAEAEPMYRDAELAAIKTNYFQETRDLLAAADQSKVSKYAPTTLQRSKDLLAQAETSLEQDRYDTDLARTLAREAKYEAKHATNMAALLQQIEKKQMTTEGLVLTGEESMKKVAAQLDVVPMFDQGYGPTSEAVLAEMDKRAQKADQLAAQVADYQQMTEGMKQQIASLESELGGVSEERAAMQARMDAEAKVRGQFTQIETLFTRQEAQVYRQGNNVLIRMVGLNFDSGKSTINSENFGLLTKVQNAIKVFPDSSVRVEGYTDSHGSDETNQTLSQQRAEAVKQYLLANMSIPASRVEAVGYGESNPIANNETAEGRVKNRRIDLVIRPNLDAMTAAGN